MPVGYYLEDNQRLASVTSIIDYTLGIADEIDKWTIKQSILAVQRASKTKKLTQEQAIEIGLEKRHQILDTARFRGTQVHQAIQNLHNNLPYELSDDDRLYYEAYFSFYKQHSIEPILEEFKVKNFEFGYAGRLDFYGKLDGKHVLLDFKTSNSVRWTYGLQLAAYKECLIKAGYPVDATYVVHIKPKKRGGNPQAELFEFNYDFQTVKWLLGLFHLKLLHDPYVKWYARTDEAAAEAELKKDSAVRTTEPEVTETVSALPSDVLGQNLDTQDSAPKREPAEARFLSELRHVYQRQVKTPPHVSSVPTTPTSQTEIPPENLVDETSEQSGVIPLDTQLSGVVRFETSIRSYRTVLDVSPLPLGKDISESPELVWDSVPDNLPLDRQTAESGT